jgi:glycosyltransferase involved in cell wall biosynthesis
MRILIVTEHYWPEAFRITDLAAGLRERGHEVEVLTGMPSYPAGRYFPGYRPWGPLSEIHDGVRITRVPIVPRGRGNAWRLTLNYGSYVAAAMARLPLRSRFDVSLVYQPSPVTTCIPALALRRATGAPVAVWVQDLWPESVVASGLARSRWLLEPIERLSRALYTSCDLVIGQSEAFVDRLREVGVEPERLACVPNWAEELYKEAPQPTAADVPWNGEFAVLFAGNLGRVQALDTVMAAARLTRDDPGIRWVFVGDGPLKTSLEAEVQAQDLADRVLFLERRPPTDMPALFARAGALLVSLKSDPAMALTIPSKVQSYLAAGRPILASLDGEGARIVEASGAGWSAPAGDAGRLAENVRRMKQLPAVDRESMGIEGRNYYDRVFDRRICLDQFEALLARAIHGARA